MDMVAEKTKESTIDFMTDGLDLQTDGEYVWAKDTTLGGDDGIAVAYALAILEADDIPHPPLECIFTVDEEVGMEGAAALDVSVLTSKILINCDSEDEGILTVSCAEGADFRSADFTMKDRLWNETAKSDPQRSLFADFLVFRPSPDAGKAKKAVNKMPNKLRFPRKKL